MKIGLASYEFRNGNIGFNLHQMQRGLFEARENGADMLCFGEGFLQGFDAMSFSYEKDCDTAISQDDERMHRLEEYSTNAGVDLAFGYYERDGETIYSSYAVIIDGKLAHNYRRISTGWKESFAGEEYREGDSVCEFEYRGQILILALCGDMWDMPERFKTNGVLIWPVYVNFSLDEWRNYENEYAEQSLLASNRALLVNSITRDPESIGGAFLFENGMIAQRLEYGKEGLLIVDI